MLMNLRKLRAEQNVDDVYDFIEEHRRSLVLPDQDIISGLYGEDILPLDPYRYNMTERLFALRLLKPWAAARNIVQKIEDSDIKAAIVRVINRFNEEDANTYLTLMKATLFGAPS